MLNLQDAIAAVQVELASLGPPPQGDAWVVYPEHTQEHQFGWLVFYGSRLFRGTGSKANAIAGNAPFLVNRLSGAVEVTGTARPVESYVTEYNARNANGGA